MCVDCLVSAIIGKPVNYGDHSIIISLIRMIASLQLFHYLFTNFLIIHPPGKISGATFSFDVYALVGIFRIV